MLGSPRRELLPDLKYQQLLRRDGGDRFLDADRDVHRERDGIPRQLADVLGGEPGGACEPGLTYPCRT